MGYTTAKDMAESGLPLEVALEYHLTANHYPPVHSVFVPTCIAAIGAIEDGEPEREIEMPNGLTRTAAHIVDGLHLDAFIGGDDADA